MKKILFITIPILIITAITVTFITFNNISKNKKDFYRKISVSYIFLNNEIFQTYNKAIKFVDEGETFSATDYFNNVLSSNIILLKNLNSIQESIQNERLPKEYQEAFSNVFISSYFISSSAKLSNEQILYNIDNKDEINTNYLKSYEHLGLVAKFLDENDQ